MEPKKDKRYKKEGTGRQKGQTVEIHMGDNLLNSFISECVELKTNKMYDKWSLLKHFTEKKLTPYQIDKIIKGANTVITNMYKNKAEMFVELQFNELFALKMQALKDGDRRLVLDINKEISKLSGLHTVKIEHSGEIEFKAIFDDYESKDGEDV